jgi:glycosyltransferase involved in cell wall biosynthesis
MPTAFVMPCLNEEGFLASAVGSLGFGDGAPPAADDVYLVLVDNGSTDGTMAVMEQVARGSRPGSVCIVTEHVRGFVPPRRRGVAEVAALAAELGAAAEEFLILQADADTFYLPDYAQWMKERLGERRGFLLEGAIKRSADFDAAHPEYVALERSVDESVVDSGVDDEDEIIVDDKACGYLLSDYLRWGGHFREFDDSGSEVHAETTRLFLRARLAHGAAKIRVNPAQAVPSRRRIEEDPSLHFATAGFPREESWVKRWHARHPTCLSVDEFARNPGDSEVREACFYRRAHNIALFAVLPALVRQVVEPGCALTGGSRLEALLTPLPRLSAAEVARSPARALLAVLDAIDAAPTAFA